MDRANSESAGAQAVIQLLTNQLVSVTNQLEALQVSKKAERLSTDADADADIVATANRSQELERENHELKQEISQLRLHLDAMKENEDSKGIHAMGEEEGLRVEISRLSALERDNTETISDLRARLEDSLQTHRGLKREKEDNERETEELPKALQEKVEKYKQKCSTQKEMRRGLEKSLKEAEETLQNKSAELDETLSRLSSYEDAGIDRDISSFDPFSFLGPKKNDDVDVQVKALKAFSHGSLPVGSRLESSRYIIERFDHNQTIWTSYSNSSRLLIIEPMYKYNANANKGKGAWERPHWQSSLEGQTIKKREIILKRDQLNWFYYGTYKCVGFTNVTFDQATELGAKNVEELVKTRAVTHSELAAPILTGMIHDMYIGGILKFDCFAFRRIGFNTHFDEVLHTRQKSGSKPPVLIPIPGGPQPQSRKRPSKQESHDKPSKKSKTV